MRWVVVIAATLLCQACTNYSELAKQAVEADLPSIGKFDSRVVSYNNLIEYPGRVLCGEYSTKNRADKNSFKPFIYKSKKLNRHPKQDDLTVYCSEDPRHSLCSNLGICWTKNSEENLNQISADIKQLAAAFEEYESDNRTLPTSEQGINALMQQRKTTSSPHKSANHGYINAIPNDPWGAPYIYEAPVFGGVKGGYKIFTLGADGQPGGVGQNIDIGLRHIEYIDHVQRLN